MNISFPFIGLIVFFSFRIPNPMYPIRLKFYFIKILNILHTSKFYYELAELLSEAAIIIMFYRKKYFTNLITFSLFGDKHMLVH